MTSRHLLGLALLSLCLAICVGCSKKSAPAKVTGTVTYNNAPVTGGNLAFHSDAGVYAAVIASDGKYTIVDMPAGEMTVTVDTEGLNPNIKKETYTGQTKFGPKVGGSGGGGAKKGMPTSPRPDDAPEVSSGNYVKIPRTYADKNKSTMKVTVKDGSQTIDIPLKD